MQEYVATGRRKNAIARVRLKEGKGDIIVNDRKVLEYFKREVLMQYVNQPFEVTDLVGKYDVRVRVNGGGLTGQAGAMRLAVARALVKINEELRRVLRTNGLLTRDPRMVERKKYGQKKARKRFQFSKR